MIISVRTVLTMSIVPSPTSLTFPTMAAAGRNGAIWDPHVVSMPAPRSRIARGHPIEYPDVLFAGSVWVRGDINAPNRRDDDASPCRRGG